MDFMSLLRALESEASVRWQAEPMAKLMMAIEGQERRGGLRFGGS